MPLDPTEIAVGVVSASSGVVVAVAVLRSTVSRLQKDIIAVFDHLHSINTRERATGERIAGLEARVKNLEDKR